MTAETLFADRYRLERRLGVGGMATVQLAMDTRLERHVAVKLLAEHLAEDSNFVSRFRREALAAARLVHPNVVQVFDFGAEESTGRQYIVMEFVDGSAARRSCAGSGGSSPSPRSRSSPSPAAGSTTRTATASSTATSSPATCCAPARAAGQARGLRHRQGGRAVRHHQGRLRAGHGGVSLPGAGAR